MDDVTTLITNLPVITENLVALGADPMFVNAFSDAVDEAVELGDQRLLRAYAKLAAVLGDPRTTAPVADDILAAASAAGSAEELEALV